MNFTVDQNTGGIAFWRCLKDVPRSAVLSAADKIGIGHLVPAEPPLPTTLRTAMEDVATTVFGKRRHEPIQTLQTAQPRTFECVRCVRGAHDNEHRFLFSATVDAAGQARILKTNRVVDPLHSVCGVEDEGTFVSLSDIHRLLQDTVDQRLLMLPGTVVTRIISTALRSWGGISINDRGGLWFFPASCKARYRTWCRHMEAAGCAFTYAEVQVSHNPEFVSHLLDEVTAEVLDGVREIQQDMLVGGSLQDRGIRLRLARVEAFFSRITQYEAITGRTLSELRGCVEGVRSALGMQRILEKSA